MSDEIDHENTKEIVCPYCGHEFEDSWEYDEAGSGEAECDSCEKTFTYEVHIRTKYSTRKVDCDDKEPAEEHRWGEPKGHHRDQENVDRLHAENPRIWTETAPYTVWYRDCEKCESSEVKSLPYKAPCPWPLQEPAK